MENKKDEDKNKDAAGVKDKKEDIVEIKRADFDRMMKQMEKQAKDIDLLYRTADKGKMAKELNKEGENLIKQVTVRTWDDTGRFVIGWGNMKVNRCEVVMGKWYEEQEVTLTLDDGETKTVSYLEFVRKTIKKTSADIISKSEETDSENNRSTFLKLQFPNGKLLLINSIFVN